MCTFVNERRRKRERVCVCAVRACVHTRTCSVCATLSVCTHGMHGRWRKYVHQPTRHVFFILIVYCLQLLCEILESCKMRWVCVTGCDAGCDAVCVAVCVAVLCCSVRCSVCCSVCCDMCCSSLWGRISPSSSPIFFIFLSRHIPFETGLQYTLQHTLQHTLHHTLHHTLQHTLQYVHISPSPICIFPGKKRERERDIYVMTHSCVCVRNDAFICVRWCIHLCKMHAHICNDAFIFVWERFCIYICALMHSYVCDVLVCVWWCIHMCMCEKWCIHIY